MACCITHKYTNFNLFYYHQIPFLFYFYFVYLDDRCISQRWTKKICGKFANWQINRFHIDTISLFAVYSLNGEFSQFSLPDLCAIRVPFRIFFTLTLHFNVKRNIYFLAFSIRVRIKQNYWAPGTDKYYFSHTIFPILSRWTVHVDSWKTIECRAILIQRLRSVGNIGDLVIVNDRQGMF